MDRSKEIEQCCQSVRADLAEALRAKRRAGQVATITATEQRAIIDHHAKRMGISPNVIQNIIA